jgi:hypothetical protein
VSVIRAQRRGQTQEWLTGGRQLALRSSLRPQLTLRLGLARRGTLHSGRKGKVMWRNQEINNHLGSDFAETNGPSHA